MREFAAPIRKLAMVWLGAFALLALVAGYNLDRRTAALNALATLEDALKAA